MGINSSAVKVLIKESQARKFQGSILTLGKQDIFINENELIGIYEEYSYEHQKEGSGIERLSRKPELAKSSLISDDFLFGTLGFDIVKSSDASDYEGADLIVDLNSNGIPEDLNEKFDVIFDGGTFEHVFHVPNAFNNVFKMLKPGGRIIHIAPSSNHIDHGFYMFSPTLFWDYYNANKFDINTAQVFRYDVNNIYGGKWEVSEYIPGSLVRVSLGGLDDGIYGVIIVATKNNFSTGDVIPQQGLYQNKKWNGTEGKDPQINQIKDFKGKGLGLMVDEYL